MTYRFTCRPKHDESLAGLPASIYAVIEETDEYILEFDEGSRLTIPIKELVRVPWE